MKLWVNCAPKAVTLPSCMPILQENALPFNIQAYPGKRNYMSDRTGGKMYDVVALGELLIDFLSLEKSTGKQIGHLIQN